MHDTLSMLNGSKQAESHQSTRMPPGVCHQCSAQVGYRGAYGAEDHAALTWRFLDTVQLSVLKREALAAPDNGVAGKARYPNAHGDQVAQRKEP